MTAQRVRVLKQESRWIGGGLLFLAWLSLTGATGDITIPVWASGLLGAAGTGAIVWGSTKAKVDRLEADMKERVSVAVFTQFKDDLNGRLDRIQDAVEKHS